MEEKFNIIGEPPADGQKPFYLNEVFWYFMLAIVLLIAIWAYFRHLNQPGPAPVGTTVVAKEANEVAPIPKVTRTVKNGAVRVYSDPAKIKLDLPDAVVKNQAESVVASTQVKGDEHPQTTTTTLNTETGEFQTFTRRDPYPWIAWDDHGKVGMYGGYKNGHPTVRIEGEQNIFQVKGVRFGITGSVDQEIDPSSGDTGTDYFIGLGASYRW